MRVDQLLVERGLAASRSQAQRLIAAGVRWRLGSAPFQTVKKNGDEVPAQAELELTDDAETRYRVAPADYYLPDLGLTDDEVAFYDALAANESAVKAMGDDKLKVIAAELITQVRKSVTIDWTLREGARAKIRVMVRRILNKYGYPPDLQEEAVKTVLQQAELLCAEWAS